MLQKVNECKAEVWRDRFERFPATGMTVQGFCDVEQVPMANYYYWRSRLANDGKPRRPKARKQVFQAVTVTPASSNLLVRFASGVQLELPAENLEAIRTVVNELDRVDRETGSHQPC